MGFISEPPTDEDGAPLPWKAAMSKKTAQSLLRVKLNDPSQIEIVREVLDAENEAMAGAPVLSLKNEQPAKRKAIADAVAKARAEAEIYAAAFGMRVLRVSRISNEGLSPGEPGYAALMQMMAAQNGPDANDVSTDVTMSVDFVLVAR